VSFNKVKIFFFVLQNICRTRQANTLFGMLELELELEFCERKILLPGWRLEAGAGVV